MLYRSISDAIANAYHTLKFFGKEVITESWQGIKKETTMWEYLNYSFSAPMPDTMGEMKRQCKPSLPWADEHFEERVSGEPLNPGKAYLRWPYYVDKKFNDENFKAGGTFSHTYMERYWPKRANQMALHQEDDEHARPMSGIRFEYGDLMDVVMLLGREPYTRQAYLPVWFPEDTGVNHGGRVPCTLGYQFIFRDGKLDVVYFIRACDMIKHFRNDVYLTIRLADWVGDWMQDRTISKLRCRVTLGNLTMHITSLHCFAQEKNLL